MAKPAFIYSFDNLGPYRFVELCAELLEARYKGFILGGIGADGGIDAEVDSILGEWHPKETDALSNQIIESGQKIIFQFKHKVTARTGQANARTQLLNLYRSTDSEVTKDLVVKKRPDVYVLITNVEINSQFRDEFQSMCKAANPQIAHYQVIGLDELEIWVTQAINLRHLYFPTLFDIPRYNLKLTISQGLYAPTTGGLQGLQLSKSENLLQIVVHNIGMLPSYVSAIMFMLIQNGKKTGITLTWDNDPIMKSVNPEKGEPLEPGRNATYHFRTRDLKAMFEKVFISEIGVVDEIQNQYFVPVPEDIRREILS